MYYVPKKNRCKISCPVSNPAVPPTRTETLFKSTLSSINAYNKGAKTVYSVFLSQQYNSQAHANKGTGNLQKRGSGGNSYAAYLARKKGKCLCCFCNQLIQNGDTGVFTYAPKIGDKAIQDVTGVVGTVISFTTGGGWANDIDTVTIRADGGCDNLFVSGHPIVFYGPGGPAATMSTAFTILETSTCP